MNSLLKLSIRYSSNNSKTIQISKDLLSIIVCPLSKDPLRLAHHSSIHVPLSIVYRYDDVSNTLINDKLGVAYPIQNGIPLLSPQDGYLINKN